jgi:phosphoribosylamine--glycine ligase/phosphoribosylformylglycinamidine cyclo-ligase
MEDGKLKILVVGKGAREHSLAWRLAQSPSVRHIYVVPGNGGTSKLDKASNINSVEANDYPALVSLVKDLGIGLLVAGPDDAVVDGIEGFFRDIRIYSFLPPFLAECSFSLTCSNRHPVLCSYQGGCRD